MRILLIHNYYQYRGGEETYIKALIKLLKEKGHKVITYTKNSNNINSFWDKIKVTAGMFWNRSVERELSEIIKEFKPDIVQSQNIFPLVSPTAYWVCKKFAVPVVQRISNYRFVCPKSTLFRSGKICELCVRENFYYSAILYKCYQQSRIASFIFSLSFFLHRYILKSFSLIDVYIFPTEFTKKYYLKNFGINEENAVVIPTFTDSSGKKGAKIKEKDYFLYAGRLTEEKGALELLEIFKNLSNIKLLIVGTGPLKNKVNKYKKYQNIMIKDYQSRADVLTYMKHAFAVIIPSLWYDVLPNVLIESYTNNVPVIVPNTGSFTDFVKNDKKNLVYNYLTFEKLQQLIKNIAKKKRKEMTGLTDNGTNIYSADFHYFQLIKAYHNVIHQ